MAPQRLLLVAGALSFSLSVALGVAFSLSRIRTMDSHLDSLVAELAQDRTHVDQQLTELQARVHGLRTDLGAITEHYSMVLTRLTAIEDRLAALTLSQTQDSAQSTSTPVPVMVVAETPEDDHLTATAKAAEEVAIQTSAYPFLQFADLSPELREELRDYDGRALFVAYPTNRWGRSYVGCVSATAIGEHGPEREFLSEENNLILQRVAELAYDIEARIEVHLNDMYLSGDCTKFPNEAAARNYLRTLLDNRSYLRVDPKTGEAWVFSPERIDSDPELRSLHDQQNTFGKQLLRGRQGVFGTRWE